MARSFARLATSIWADDDFRQLSPDAQRVYMLAFSQANIATTGVVPYSARRWARMAAGTAPADITKAVDELVHHPQRYVLVDEDTEELLVRSFVKNDGVLRSPNSTLNMSRAYTAIVSGQLRRAFLEALPADVLEGIDSKTRAGLSEHFLNDFLALHPKGSRKGSPNPSENPSPNGYGKGSPKGSPNPSETGSGNPSEKGSPSRAPARGAHARTRPEPEPEPEPPPLPRSASTKGSGSEQPGRPAAPPHGDEEDEKSRIREARATVGGDEPPKPDRRAQIRTEADVWNALARLDLDAEVERGGKVTNRQGWLRTAAANRRDAHGDELDDWTGRGLTLEAFAEHLADAGGGQGDDEQLRRPPDADATAAMLAEREASWTRSRAEESAVDAEIEALPAAAVAELEERARVHAASTWSAPGRIPAPVIRAAMRQLHTSAG